VACLSGLCAPDRQAADPTPGEGRTSAGRGHAWTDPVLMVLFGGRFVPGRRLGEARSERPASATTGPAFRVPGGEHQAGADRRHT
jgi:hypothetical protein